MNGVVVQAHEINFFPHIAEIIRTWILTFLKFRIGVDDVVRKNGFAIVPDRVISNSECVKGSICGYCPGFC